MENNSYFHDLFVREDPQKCLKMIRTGGAKNAAGERVFMNNEESVTPKKRKCKETGRYAQAGKQFGVDRIVLDENDHKDWIGSGSAINMEYHAKEEEKRSSPCYRPSKRKRREPVVEVSNRQQNHIDEPCTNDRSKARAKKRYVVEIQDLLTTQGDNSEDEGKQKESTQYLSSSSSSQDEIVPTSAKARNKKLIDD